MRGLPPFRGRPVLACFQPSLTVSRGQLYSNSSRGSEVHAASFLAQRSTVFDSALLARPRELRRIAVHELFHFAWWRLGNPLRREWDELLGRELSGRARGELGWSAEMIKKRLPGTAAVRRLYRCESFCDTAAWYFTGGRHSEYTLAPRFRRRRKEWFDTLLAAGPLSI